MELLETNKSSAADEPENKEKANWMQVREAVAACSRALLKPHMSRELVFKSKL
jgi:hypothetical protein